MKTPVLLLMITVVAVVGASVYLSATSSKTRPTGNQNAANQHLNEGNANVPAVPRIIVGSGSSTLATAISSPNTTGWKATCLTGFPCITLPVQNVPCLIMGEIVVQASGTCADHPDDAPAIILRPVADQGTPSSLILGTTLLGDPSIQHIATPIIDTVSGHGVYCLDDLQGMYCVVNLGAGKRYLLQGNYYHTQAADTSMFDGALRKLLTQ